MISQLCCTATSSPLKSRNLPNGVKIIGDANNGKLEGFCSVQYPNGDRYQGQFMDGNRQGKGKMYYFKGDLYIGDWLNNDKHGTGQYFYDNGDRYHGQFQKNQMHGKGTFYQLDGSYFQGIFYQNKKNGKGLYHQAKLDKYIQQTWVMGHLKCKKQKRQDKNILTNEKKRILDPPLLLKKNSSKVASQQKPQSSSQDSQYQPNSCLSLDKSSDSSDNQNHQIIETCKFNIQQWLKKLQMNMYIDSFVQNHIDCNNLLLIRDAELKQLGVKLIGHRKLIARQISQFKRRAIKHRAVKQIRLKQPIKDKEQPQVQQTSSSSQDSQPQQQKIKKKPRRNIQQAVKVYLQNNGIKLSFMINKKQIQIIKEIGKGAYGKVQQGQWLGQQVAVKIYCKRLRNSHIGNFIQQIRLINRLLSPYIVLYMGMYISNNQYAMVTEYLQNGSLFDHLHKKNTNFNTERIIFFAEDIILGMIYLHGRNVFHCDLKSSNVLLDTSWNLKLCDFGLSRLRSKKNLGRIGTVNWMAPEIMRGQKFQAQADVYSFGMILWEMLTKTIPYQGLSKIQIISLIGHENKIPLKQPEGHPMIVEMFKLCTRRDAKKRPSFQDLLTMIQKQKVAIKFREQSIWKIF